LEYPMDQGAITETGWDAMERLWDVSVVVCVACFALRVHTSSYYRASLVA